MEAVKRLQNVKDIATIKFDTNDVVRHPLVAEMLRKL
jgi:phosphate starvation-inducible protein PhoH